MLHNTLTIKMDSDLYDEFGNYIGPELESDEEEEEQPLSPEPEPQDIDVSNVIVPKLHNMKYINVK